MNLLLHLMRFDHKIFKSTDRVQVGKSIENFVAVELSKQASFTTTPTRLYHYRTSSQQEVDFILESHSGYVVGVEVKSTSKICSRNFWNFETLKTELGEKFKCGFAIHPVNNVVQFGDLSYSLPLDSLWH